MEWNSLILCKVVMSWNDKNSDTETVEIKQHFVEMFGDKIAYFYSVNDYMN